MGQMYADIGGNIAAINHATGDRADI